MYCGECGTKNSNSSKVCENCGAPLVNDHSNGQTLNKKQAENAQQSMKTIIPIIAGLIIIIAVIATYSSLKKRTLPETVAASYFEAYKDLNGKKMYSFFEKNSKLEKNEFTTKKMFIKTIATEEQKKEMNKILSYKIADVKLKNNGTEASVKIKYTTKISSISNVKEINLKKSSKKKYLFFDNWEVSLGDNYIRNNYSIYLPKDSTAKVEGIDISKYLNKEKSTSIYDVYIIPKIFRGGYNLDSQLSYGFNFKETMNTSLNNYYKINISKEVIPAKVQNDMIANTKNLLTTFYNGAISRTGWEQIKLQFANLDEETLKKYENSYNTLVNRIINNSNQLTKIEFTEIKLDDTTPTTSLTDEISMNFKLSYKYDVNYKSLFSNEIKTSSKTTSGYVKMNFRYVNKEFIISEIKSMPTGFY